MRTLFYSVIALLFAFACKRPDNLKPVVEHLIINAINTDTLKSDTVFDVSFPIDAAFKLTDNEGVEQYRFEFIKTTDSLPDLQFLEIKSTGGLNEFNGNTSVSFSQSILDTLPNYPLYYFITVDCFDKSGNQALQKKNIIQIIVN